MRPASFANPVITSGEAYSRRRIPVAEGVTYLAPEPRNVCPFGGGYLDERRATLACQACYCQGCRDCRDIAEARALKKYLRRQRRTPLIMTRRRIIAVDAQPIYLQDPPFRRSHEEAMWTRERNNGTSYHWMGREVSTIPEPMKPFYPMTPPSASRPQEESCPIFARRVAEITEELEMHRAAVARLNTYPKSSAECDSSFDEA